MRRPQIQRSYLARPATDECPDHQNNKRTSEKHMETVRGGTGPQDRPFQTVENCQGNRRQITTSKLGRHTSSRETRLVSREIKRKSLISAVTFTTDQVIKGISNCINTKALGPDKLSIFHIKNLGPNAI